MIADASALFRLRPHHDSDVAFIASTWVHSYKQAEIPSGYLWQHSHVVDKLLARCGALVFCRKEHEQTLHAWVCAERDWLHYVYVGKELRHQGLAKALILGGMKAYPQRIYCSHRWPGAGSRFVFNPYLAVGT